MTEEQLQIKVHPDLISYFENEEEADSFLHVFHLHVADAVSTSLVLCKRFHCMKCIYLQVLPVVFDWVNETGHKFITKDDDFDGFLQKSIVLAMTTTAHIVENEKCDKDEQTKEESSESFQMPMVSDAIN